VIPDMKIDPTNAIPVFEGQPAGGPQHSAAKPEPWIEARKEPGSSPEQFDLHARNFLDCIKSRQPPISDVEGGHRNEPWFAARCAPDETHDHPGRRDVSKWLVKTTKRGPKR